jgi:hypothetical protein
MVWLAGPSRGAFRPRLHDAPPGYRPPRPGMSLKERQRQAREDQILLRVLIAILIPTAVAVIVIIVLMMATHG